MTHSALMPDNEDERLAAVNRYDILDTPPDGAFDRVTALAARLFDVPIAIVSIVDSDRIWFKSHHGLDVEEIGRDPGLCASAILSDRPWLVADAKVDPRTLANPLVAGEFGLRFYAGAPLTTGDGFNLGTLCVIDHEPREVTDDEVANLSDLASVVMDELELRISARRTVSLEAEMRRRAETVAASLQESLIPPVVPQVEGLDVAWRYHVAQLDQVGGDFYDVVTTDWGTALVVGDSCGRGPLAASYAGTARWTLHTVMMDDPDPARALERLNTVLCRSRGNRDRYVTAAAVSLQRGSGGTHLSVAVGGHPHPLILRGDGTVEAIGTTGPLAGWFSDISYSTSDTVLQAGDTVVLFTDGLLEGIAGQGQTDDGALRAVLAPLARRMADEVAAGLDLAMGANRRDDAAFLVTRIL
ncbi:MAG TPA: SpoIIE family protein phosphatase [Acidimicrobiales bacterium]|nr:SpoIIE family protein phosphatase [Acidimicrobiales bacterium]